MTAKTVKMGLLVLLDSLEPKAPKGLPAHLDLMVLTVKTVRSGRRASKATKVIKA